MEETIMNRFLKVFTDISVKTGFWRHKPNPELDMVWFGHVYELHNTQVLTNLTTVQVALPGGGAKPFDIVYIQL